jgi:hypothetical protein
MKGRLLVEWIIVILIILFFSIPFCGLAFMERVTSWHQCASSLVYYLFLK